MRPNVLLVVLDTARCDVVEPYGAKPGSTPAIADLARRGRAVPRAYAPAAWTLPSHASMFTGLLPRQLGLGQPPEGGSPAVRPVMERMSGRLLAPVLQRAGYRTDGFTTNLWVSELTGFDIGFEHFRYVNSGRDERMNALLEQGRRAQLAWAREGLRADSDDGAAEVGRALRAAIADWSGQPTFWFVNLVECHSPYLPPRPWNDLGRLDRARAALENKRHLNFAAIHLYAAGLHTIPSDAMARLRHLYGRAVTYMDDWLSSVLEALDARGILDETLVIVTSDHGENFGEGGLIAHGLSVDERLIHVPMVLAGPGAELADDVFSLASLPLLLGRALELREAPWGVEELPVGVAVAQYDPMAPADSEVVQRNAARFNIGPDGLERICARYTGVTDGRHKLVVRDDAELFYDLLQDAGEERPADADVLPQDAVRKLREALEHPAVSQVATAPAGPPDPLTASAEELAEIERRMQLLGYM